MKCTWGTVSPGERCTWEALPSIDFCRRHWLQLVSEARTRAATRPPKQGILAKYSRHFVMAAIGAAGVHAFELLELILDAADTIEIKEDQSGVQGAVFIDPGGHVTRLPTLPYGAFDDEEMNEDQGADAWSSSRPPEPAWLAAAHRVIGRMILSAPPQVRRLIIETTQTRTSIGFLNGSPDMPYSYEEALNRLSEEEVDGLLHHWGVPQRGTDDVVDDRLRAEKLLTDAHLGSPHLTVFGDHVAQRARLRRNLPLPDRFLTPAERQRKNTRET